MLAEFAIFPIGSQESLSGAVAAIAEIVDASGLDYRLTSMGTIIEGDWDEVMDVVRKCHDEMRKSFNRVYTKVAIDDRAGAVGRITGKVESVERKTGKKFRQ